MATLTWIDYLIMAVYLAFVLGVGYALKNRMKTSLDFFLSGRKIPAWITGLAFVAANLGALEVIGVGASSAKYGIITSHFYWIGAIPAMVFIGIFMMPFYYGSRARSVPEFLKLRFDEKTRAFNALTFAAMTVFVSGVSMYAMGKLLNLLLHWNFLFCILVSALIILCYIFMGGLTGAIYNEVLQFFLAVFGFAPLVYLSLRDVGGWGGLKASLAKLAVVNGFPANAYTSSWANLGDPSHNPIGIEWFGLAMGLGFVLSFGYWCTDFLIVQRAMAADSMLSARRTPLIAAIPKMFTPFLLILPAMAALVVSASGVAVKTPSPADPAALSAPAVPGTYSANPSPLELVKDGQGLIPAKFDETTRQPKRDSRGRIVLDYDLTFPMLLVHYFPTGLLGLGLTALLAAFMSGMAGNVTAFNTVWTYDIYQTYIKPGASDQHYLWMGRFATVAGIVLSLGSAYIAATYNNVNDLIQLLFAFVNAPLFATFALGMFWKRATGHGAFVGLLAGTLGAALHHSLTVPAGQLIGGKGGYLASFLVGHALKIYPSELSQGFWTAICSFSAGFVVTIAVSLLTKPRPDQELKGLVYSLTPKPDESDLPWYKRPVALAVAVLVLTVFLNLIFY